MSTMEQNLVGYLLESLDEDTTRQVENYLQENPAAQEKLDRLRRALEPLAEDREPPRPPCDLVIRTLAHIAEHSCKETAKPVVMPSSRPAGVVHPPRWRRFDVLVTCCLLMTIGLLAFPMMSHIQVRQSKADCQENLRRVSTALQSYHDMHQQFPNVAEQTHARAGLFLPMLREGGFLPANDTLGCPTHGQDLPVGMNLEQLRALTPDQMEELASRLSPSYAYSLGYRVNGKLHPPAKSRDAVNSLLPILADNPPPVALIGNSNNHGGRGQNVLYSDGHVTFSSVRHAGVDRDDIYLNKNMKVAAGMDPLDTVLGHSAAKP